VGEEIVKELRSECKQMIEFIIGFSRSAHSLWQEGKLFGRIAPTEEGVIAVSDYNESISLLTNHSILNDL